MKRFIAMVLVFALCVSTQFDVYASEQKTGLSNFKKIKLQHLIDNITFADAEVLSLEELKYAATLAETDETATLIFNELVKRYSVMPLGTTSLADNYLKVTSITNSGRAYTVNYKITAKVPSGATLFLGYEFPSSTRTSGSSVNLSLKDVGTYSHTFNVLSLMCQFRIYGSMTARNYTGKSVFATFDFSSANREVDYHEITAAEVTGYYLLYSVVPGIVLKMYPGSQILQFVGKAMSVGSTTVQVLSSYGMSFGVPAPVVGHYYKVETWYDTNKIYAHVTVWNTKAAYNNGDLPIYEGEDYVKAELPTF